jgi:1-hydroxycarotenoid 3,4-desaturase
MTGDSRQDVIVVGSGVGGLSAAVLLGAAGLRVLLLEGANHWGGKAGVQLIDGVEVDTGPSVLTLPETFEPIFQAAGTCLKDELELVRPSPSFRYRFSSGPVVDVFVEKERTLQSVQDSLGTTARKELERYLERAAEIWEAAAPHFVWSAAPEWTGLLTGGWSRLRAVTRIDPLRTLQESIDATVRTPQLRMILQRYATYNGSDARRAPATLGCIAHVELSLGGFGVAGGMHELVRALVRAAERVGVQMVQGQWVSELSWEKGRVTGVRTADGKVHQARAVVFNGEAAALAEGLVPTGAPAPAPAETELSMSAYNAIYQAKRRVGAEGRVAHEVIFPADYLQEFSALFDRGTFPEQPTLYLCAQELCHRRAGWEHHEPLFVMANAPALRASVKAQSAEAFSAVVEQRLLQQGLLDAEDRVVFQRTPEDLARRFPSSRGALYGAASNGPMAAFRRPSNTAKRLPGLYLASGSAHPGGGLPMVAASGRQAASAVLADLGTLTRLPARAPLPATP